MQPIAPELDDLSNLPENLRGIVQYCQSDAKCPSVLHLLYQNLSTMMAVADIAALAGISVPEAQSVIDDLYRLGLLRQVSVAEFVFYGVSSDPERIDLVRRFEGWCEMQRVRWEALNGLLPPD